MDIRFLLVDALNLIRRVYAAQPGEDGPERAETARETCTRSLQRALRDFAPSHAAGVFDGEGPGWRHALYPDYKAGRSPMPEALRRALPAFEEAFAGLGVRSVRLPATEADDVIATLAAKVAARGGRVRILSTDKMFLQLLSDRIGVRDHFRQEDLDEAHVRAKFGVGAAQLVDLLALAGDSTNHIPGLPRVGLKTAARLLAAHGDLESLLAAAGTLKGTLREAVRDHGERARLSRRLVTLRTDLALGLNLRAFRIEVC